MFNRGPNTCANHLFSFLIQGDVEEDESVPDNEQDIRPRFHKAKTHGGVETGATPNIDLCFDKEDNITFRNDVNDITMHH